MTFTTSISIQELTSPVIGESARELILTDSALPFSGAAWDGEQRIVTKWYSGSPIASQQVLGDSYGPSSWSGEWRRHHLGKNPVTFTNSQGVNQQVVSPNVLADIFDTIRKAGQLLRVIYAVDGTTEVAGQTQNERVRKTRIGRLKNFNIQVNTHQIIAWTATFEWTGEGLAPRPITSIEGLDSDNGVAALLALQGQGFQGLPAVEKSLKLADLEKIAAFPKKILTDASNQIAGALSDIREATLVARKVASTPREVAQGIVASAKSAASTAKTCVDAMSRLPVELATTNDNVTDTIEAASWKASNVEDMQKAARAAKSVERRTERAAGPDERSKAMRVHVCRTGDTPANVAQRFYGDSSQATLIMQANGLPWHLAAFEPGKVLVIPDGATVRG